MSGTAGRSTTVTVSRDAVTFIEQVEEEARRRGAVVLGLHHWAAVACSRTFLARTIARGADIKATTVRMREALDAGSTGPDLPPEAVLLEAKTTAIARGESRIHAWHLVHAVLHRVGIATRDGEAERLPTSDGSEPVAANPEPSKPDAPKPDPRTPKTPAETTAVRRNPRPPVPQPTPTLDQCGVNWTLAAVRGELPPMVGREAELRSLIEGVCRPTKPNVLLVGEPGVGKSALVEGLAQRIAAGAVPPILAGRPLIALNMAELTRESRYYGAMEARMATLIAEARSVRAILFIDEGHAMTGAGGREGTADVASILKPVLARGDLSIISATTEDEYRRFVLPNGALERRFTVVHVGEPGRSAVRRMLGAHRDAIAASHGVTVDDEALDRMLQLTAATASHRREPDRSRDLLDQVVARAIAEGATDVACRDVETVALAASGAPEVTDEALAALARALVRRGLLRDPDAVALVDRLATTFSGLALAPRRPRATVLLLSTPDGSDGLAIAEELATHVYGGAERVISIGVGGITEPSAISGFLGTTQGFIGHGDTLPIHGLAERPHSVLLLRGVDAAHLAFGGMVARALRDGYFTDAGARRIGLSQAIVVLEARAPGRARRTLGFGPAGTGSAPTLATTLAVAAVGADLAAECDLAIVLPALTGDGGTGAGRAWVADTLGRLAESYRAAGVELAWEPEVETTLAADLGTVSPRERERAVEIRVGRAVRPCLRSGRRPVRARVRGTSSGLVADAEP